MPKARKDKAEPPTLGGHGMGGRNIPKLATLSGVRQEMARMYRRALVGKLPTDELSRFVYALSQIRVSLETEAVVQIQERMTLLEARLKVAAYQRSNGDGNAAKVLEYRPAQ